MTELSVSDSYRTNPLSLKPGGYTVKVEYYDGQILYYDKIKYPNAYIKTIKSNSKVKSAKIV